VDGPLRRDQVYWEEYNLNRSKKRKNRGGGVNEGEEDLQYELSATI